MKETYDVVKQTASQVYTQDAFTNSLARLGFAQPNILEGTQYPLTRLTRQYNLMTALYRDHWIIRRVIDLVAKDMMKNWIEIISDLTPDELKRVEREIRITRTRQSLLSSVKWGRLYGGAAAIMLIDGQEDILDQPLDIESIDPGDYKGLMVLDRWSGIYPQLETVDDINSPEYGLPKYYVIKPDNENGYGEQVIVHHTRVLRFIGYDLPFWEKLAETYWGASVIESVFEELKKRDNTSWNIAQLIFLSNVRILKMSDLGQLLSTTSQKTKKNLYNVLQAQNLLMSNMGVYVMDKDDDFQTSQYSFGGLSEIYELFMLDVAGASDIPATRLFGRSPQGMNSTGEGELTNYYDMIENTQEEILRPVLEKLLPVICMSSLGYVPDDLNFSFNPVETPSQKDRAELIWRTIEAIRGAYSDGLISQRIGLKELKEAGEPLGLFTNVTDKDIEEADDSLQQENPMEEMNGEQQLEVQSEDEELNR